MIDFRYHIVSIVAVFLALALGLFLGSTTLQGTVLHGIQSQVDTVTARNRQLQQQQQRDQQHLTDDQNFLSALAPYAVANKLATQSVAVIAMPGVDSATMDQIATLVQQAGGSVTARVEIQPSFLDPAEETLLTTLANRLRPAGVRLPAGGSGPVRAVTEVGAVIAAKPGVTAVSPSQMQQVLSSFRDAHLIDVTGLGDTRPAALAVLLVPGPAALSAVDRARSTPVALALARELTRAGVGAVLAGPEAAATAPGLVAAAKNASDRPANLATVQGDDGAAGQIAVVFGLVEVFDGRSGDFGPGLDPPLPSASPGS